jgi:hypothetical protein
VVSQGNVVSGSYGREEPGRHDSNLRWILRMIKAGEAHSFLMSCVCGKNPISCKPSPYFLDHSFFAKARIRDNQFKVKTKSRPNQDQIKTKSRPIQDQFNTSKRKEKKHARGMGSLHFFFRNSPNPTRT